MIRFQRIRAFRTIVPVLIFFLLFTILLNFRHSATVQAEPSGTGMVSFTKTDSLVNDVSGNGMVNPGDTIRYDMTISNTTGSDLTNVILTDVLDANVTWDGVWQSTPLAFSHAVTTTEGSPVVITLTGSDLDSDTLTFSVLTSPSSGSLGAITPQTATTVGVTYTPNMGFSGTDSFTFQVMDDDGNTDSDTISISVLNSDLAVSKSVQAVSPFAGERITYTVTAGNQGSILLTNVTISDVLPADITYVNHTADISTAYNSATGAWNIPNLGVGVTYFLTIYADINPGTIGQTITNTAVFVSMDQIDGNPNNNGQSAAFTVQPRVDIEIAKTVDDNTPLEGDTIVYTVSATNNGPDDATGIQITDALPAGVTYVSSDQAGYTPPLWTIGNLNASQSATLNITATVNAMTAGNIYTNTATVTAVTETDVNSGNDSDQAAITVNLAPTAVDDNPGSINAYQVSSGATLTVPNGPADPVERNDSVGFPAATVSSFGGGDLGGTVTDNAAGATVAPIPGYTNGSLTVNADGSFAFTPPTTPTAFTGNFQFDYRLTNAVGTSDATVTIQVQSGPTAVNDPNGGLPANSTPPSGSNPHPYHFAANSSNNTISGVNGLLQNDNLAAPPANLFSFGGGDIGGTVTTNSAGATAMSAGHTLTVDATGVVTYTPATNFSGLFTFNYRLQNVIGFDDATVTMAVGNRPLCTNDAYNSTGNVGIQVAAGGVLLNDTGDQIAVTAVQGSAANIGNPTATSVTGGSVTLNSNGSFTYMPPAGYVGNDTFTYDLDNNFNAPSTCTVTVTVSDMIWFIDNSAPGGGNGRLNTPFNTLAAFNAIQAGPPPNAQNGNTIFIHTGSGNYTGGITLRNSQFLIGQGATASINAIAGITLPPNSNTLPATGGTRPVITNGSGSGITLGSGNLIRGLNIGNTSTSSGAGISGSTVGALTVSEMSISGQGRAVDINGGTLNVVLDSVAVTSSTNGGFSLQNTTGTTTISALNMTTTGGTGFLANSAGTINVTGSTNLINATSGTAVNLTNTTIGPSGVTFQSISSSGADTGITLNNTGTGNFTVTGVGTTDGSGGTLSNLNDHGIELLNAQNVSISNMNLTNAAATQEVNPNTTTCTNLANGTNTGCNAPVHMETVTNISLTNLTINTSVQHGINGNNVNGLSISNTDLTGIGNQNKENGMHFINLLGTVNFNNVSVIGSDTRNVLIENNTGTANVTVSNSTFNTAGSEVGLDFLGLGTANITFSVTDSSFTDNNSVQLKALAEDTSVIDATITGNTFDGDPNVTGNSGIDLVAADTGKITFDVIGTGGNPQIFQPFRSTAINVFASGGGTASGRVNGNTINGSAYGAGISAVAQVSDFNGTDPSITIEIDGNNIDQIEGAGLAGIHIEALDGNNGVTGTATVDATVTNNTVRTTDNVFLPVGGADAAIQVYLTDLNNGLNRVCLNATGNATQANGGTFGETDFFFGNDPVLGTNSGIGQMQGYATNVTNTWFTVNSNTTTTTPTRLASELGPIVNATCNTVAMTSNGMMVVEGNANENVTVVKQTAVSKPNRTTNASELVVPIGTMPDGKSITISVNVTVNDPFPDMVSQVSNQASLTADGALNLNSNDPDTIAADDATVTAVTIIETYYTYLPLIMNKFANLPDLVVEAISVSGSTVSVTIRNDGIAATTEDFWVDLYINPNPAPTAVNQTWNLLASEGAVWGVTQSIDVGESLVLTTGDTYYDASNSNLSGTIPAGTQIYAQVDSANTLTTYGAVQETDEINGNLYNNIRSLTTP